MRKRLLVVPFAMCLLASPAAIASDAGAPLVATDAPALETTPAPPDIEGDPAGAVTEFVAAIKEGNWKMVAALILALLMLILSKVRDRIEAFKGDRGGAVLVMVLGLGSGFAAALAADGVKIDWKLAVGIVMTVWTSVGGYTWFKRIINPKD